MKKVLVIRFSSIGDIVLTSPILRCLKKQHPEIEIHYLTKSSFSFIVEQNEYVSKVHTIDNDIDEVLPQLKAEEFNFVVDLHHNLRTWRLKQKLKTASKAFPKLNFEKFMLTTFKRRKMPDIHVVDRYFEAVASLGVENDKEGLDYFLPVNVILPSDIEHIKDYVAVVIGAQFATKKMPVNKLIALIQKIDSTVLLLGGPTDIEAGKQIAEKCTNSINLCGRMHLNESALVIKNAKKVITHDTGLMHIAAAFKKPIISIWGNTVPELGMYPYVPSDRALFTIHQVELPCRPCSKIGHQKCPKGHFKCMELQDLEEIAAATNR